MRFWGPPVFPVPLETYALYCATMAVFAITPGPANLFAIATGIQRGPRAGLIGVAGMNVATLVWFCAAGLGLFALIKAAPDAFHWLGLASAAYIAWLGAQSLWAGWQDSVKPLDAAKPGAAGRALADGFLVQIANPKAVIFFTAVLPPFLNPDRDVAPQLAAFAAATITADAVAMSGYALAGGVLSARFQSAAFRRGFAIAVGLLLIASAALVASRA
jgi:threonine/homoserine/homoserine lactone efflux protein